jgi:C2H2-type zinc finger protein/C2H2 type zinc finger protein
MAKTHKFYCTQYQNYQLWSGTRFLEFRGGVLETDDLGAAVIRRHPMYGRLFTDTPPLSAINKHPELRLADAMILPMDSYDCQECDQTFPSRMALQIHLDEAHNDRSPGEGPVPQPFVCDDCSSVFTTRIALEGHRHRKHRKEVEDNGGQSTERHEEVPR